jgi:hypothetical protein
MPELLERSAQKTRRTSRKCLEPSEVGHKNKCVDEAAISALSSSLRLRCLLAGLCSPCVRVVCVCVWSVVFCFLTKARDKKSEKSKLAAGRTWNNC